MSSILSFIKVVVPIILFFIGVIIGANLNVGIMIPMIFGCIGAFLGGARPSYEICKECGCDI